MTQLRLAGFDHVEAAIERLRLHEPEEGYYLAFSGGKDSQAIHRLAELAGVRFEAHRNVVCFEPPELGRFIRREYPGVTWERHEGSFAEMLLAKQFPPLRRQRWCCELMKEKGGGGRIIVTGVRWAESRQRARRRMFEGCYKDETKHYLNPIIDWTADDVWGFLEDQGIRHCELYDRGWRRIGCLMCPCATTPKRRRDAEAYPRVRAWLVRQFERLVTVRRERGKPFTNWTTGEELFEWWIADKRRGKPDVEGQKVMVYE